MRKLIMLFWILCFCLVSACQPATTETHSTPVSSLAASGADSAPADSIANASSNLPSHEDKTSSSLSDAEANTQTEDLQQPALGSQEIVIYIKGLSTTVDPGSRQAEDIMQAVTALCEGTGQIVPLAMPEAPAGQEVIGPIEEVKNTSALEISYGQGTAISFQLEVEDAIQTETISVEKILIAPEQQLVFLYADGGYRNGPIRFYEKEDFAAIQELIQPH